MSDQRKGLLLILDGVGDRPHILLDGKTPLEQARTPLMDNLLVQGQCGMMDPVLPGIPVSTHTGTAILMGMAWVDAARLQRGPVEAMGIDLGTQQDDLILRCNFAHLSSEGEQLIIEDRRAGRIFDQTDQLTALLQDIPLPYGIQAHTCPATQHRVTLRLRGKNLSTKITDTDPGTGCHVPLETCLPTDPNDPAACQTAEAVNRFIQVAHQRLDSHPINKKRAEKGLIPANGLITRGAGHPEQSESLVRHLGLKSVLISSEATVTGVGKMLGYKTINDPSFTADSDTDIEAKMNAAAAALQDHDFVVLHIKGTDICAHDLDPQAKCDLIERIDTALERINHPELIIAITGDHSTDSTTGRHTGDPVPSLISGPGIRRDNCKQYGESTCMQGGMGRINGTGFLASMLDAMNRLHNLKPDDCRFFHC